MEYAHKQEKHSLLTCEICLRRWRGIPYLHKRRFFAYGRGFFAYGKQSHEIGPGLATGKKLESCFRRGRWAGWFRSSSDNFNIRKKTVHPQQLCITRQPLLHCSHVGLVTQVSSVFNSKCQTGDQTTLNLASFWGRFHIELGLVPWRYPNLKASPKLGLVLS